MTEPTQTRALEEILLPLGEEHTRRERVRRSRCTLAGHAFIVDLEGRWRGRSSDESDIGREGVVGGWGGGEDLDGVMG